MNTAAQHLELETRNLTSALDVLVKHFRHDATTLGDGLHDVSTTRLSVLPGAGHEIHDARRNILASMSKLHMLLDEPAEFMQNLIVQSQLLSCLTWMAEFQVLAYIPLKETVPISDIAELASLPASQLARVIRMAATSGFLCEPQPGQVAHTSLSAAFVQRLNFLDATLFLGKVSAPTCLRMAEMTKRGCESDSSSQDGAYTTTPMQSFPTILSLQSPKLQRSWSTFLQCLGDVDDSIDEVLIRLDWHRLGKATIVDTCARSISDVALLANRFPVLNFIVQSDSQPIVNTTTRKSLVHSPLATPIADSKPCDYFERIAIQKRTPGSPQTITDAAVYLLRVPSPSLSGAIFNDKESLRYHIRSELTAHFGVLRANPAAKFVLSLRPLPEAKGVNPRVEAMARARDLAKMALVNGGDLELNEVLEIVEGMHDEQGRLAVINKIQCQNSATVVLSIRYQS